MHQFCFVHLMIPLKSRFCFLIAQIWSRNSNKNTKTILWVSANYQDLSKIPSFFLCADNLNTVCTYSPKTTNLKFYNC